MSGKIISVKRKKPEIILLLVAMAKNMRFSVTNN